jgi:hypothetical protein
MNLQDFELFKVTDIYWHMAWAIAPTVVALVVLIVLRVRRGRIKPSQRVDSTVMGKLGGGLPAELRLLADAGSGRPAHETLGEVFLRPAWGLRTITIGGPFLAAYFMTQMHSVDHLQTLPFDLTLNSVICLIIFHVAIYTNTYELRYDSDRFAHRNWFYQRREFGWRDILMIRHDNAYFYEIHTKDRRKAYVPKHLTGIEGFVETVQAHIALNESD